MTTTTGTIKSLSMTQIIGPRTQTNAAGLENGGVRQSSDFATINNGTDDGTVIAFVSVPADAMMVDPMILTSLAGTGLCDLGAYSMPPDGQEHLTSSQIADRDLFLSASSLTTTTAAGPGTGNYTMAKAKQPLWEACGLTSRPDGGRMIVAATVTTDIHGAAATTDLGLAVQFVMPEGG